MKITINQASKHENKEVTIGAWLANKRSSGKIAFLQLRDGTGFIQGVVVKNNVSEDVFNLAKNMNQESSMYITGTIVEDTRSSFGYEMQVNDIELIDRKSTRLNYSNVDISCAVLCLLKL